MNGIIILQDPVLGYGRWQVLGGGTFPPNTNIQITCPITSQSTGSARVKVKLLIYEGSVLPTHGTKLKEYLSAEKTIAPGAGASFVFSHTTIEGTIDRRDVGVEVQYWNGSTWVADGSNEWDDLYYVRPTEYSFEIGTPTVNQS
ncbi:MAG: hypothetical protein PHQ43_05400 [Dehalococcoidales bacterium]|nr:hypothetical protein [Dehalococcoidales bacterium]